MNSPIKIWRFDDAPEEYRALKPAFQMGDWVALIPQHLTAHEGIIDVVSSGWAEGVETMMYEVSPHPVDGGAVVVVGSYWLMMPDEDES